MQVLKHMQLTRIMIITKRTITFALAVVFILGLTAKIAFGATFVLPVSQLDASASVATCASGYSPFQNFSFNDVESHEVRLSGTLRYFTIWLKNIESTSKKIQIFNCDYKLAGAYPNTPCPNFSINLGEGDYNKDICTPYTLDFGSEYIFDNGSLNFGYTLIKADGNRDGGYSMCGTFTRPVDMGYRYQNYLLVKNGGCTGESNYLPYNTQDAFYPAYATEEVLPAPNVNDVSIIVNDNNTVKLLGTTSNAIGYLGLAVDIYDLNDTLISANNSFVALNELIGDGSFILHLTELTGGSYRARFRFLTSNIMIQVEASTVYDFVLSNPIPAFVVNPDNTITPVGIITNPKNPRDWYLLNSDYTTPTALFTTITDAIYPVLNAIGQWSISFNGRFLTVDAIADGQTIGNGIATVSAYASNLNGFFGDLPIAQALAVFLIFNLALAVLASIRFIIKLIK